LGTKTGVAWRIATMDLNAVAGTEHTLLVKLLPEGQKVL
jgi:hypothetical protein